MEVNPPMPGSAPLDWPMPGIMLVIPLRFWKPGIMPRGSRLEFSWSVERLRTLNRPSVGSPTIGTARSSPPTLFPASTIGKALVNSLRSNKGDGLALLGPAKKTAIVQMAMSMQFMVSKEGACKWKKSWMKKSERKLAR